MDEPELEEDEESLFMVSGWLLLRRLVLLDLVCIDHSSSGGGMAKATTKEKGPEKGKTKS